TAGGSARQVTVYSLTPRTAYQFTVYAVNSAGRGPESSLSNTVTIGSSNNGCPSGYVYISYGGNPGACMQICQHDGDCPNHDCTLTSDDTAQVCSGFGRTHEAN